LQEQFENQFSSNLDGVDMVIAAPGSPLQVILSSVYHIDAPTGNISYQEVKPWMEHPFVETAIPLAFGDNYRGFKIVGTTPAYADKYDAKLAKGKMYATDFEVVIGSAIAEKLSMGLGDTFFGTHGDAEEGHVHEEFAYKIVGILAPTAKVIDNLILCSVESVWAVHDDHDHHGDETHVHEDVDRDITAVLIKFKNKMGIVSWGRMIAQNTKMMAAMPALEINRLFSLFGIGLEALQYLAYGIMLISGMSIFIALYNTLKERKYEFALMRVSGAGRGQLLRMVLAESLMLSIVGFVLGTLVGRGALFFISNNTDQQFKMTFDPLTFIWDKEGYLFLVTIFVGILAAIIPALKAYRLNISKTLANA
jgi:putative ABC transport system permease protein